MDSGMSPNHGSCNLSFLRHAASRILVRQLILALDSQVGACGGLPCRRLSASDMNSVRPGRHQPGATFVNPAQVSNVEFEPHMLGSARRNPDAFERT